MKLNFLFLEYIYYLHFYFRGSATTVSTRIRWKMYEQYGKPGFSWNWISFSFWMYFSSSKNSHAGRSKVGLIQLVMESRESLIRSPLRMPKQDHQRDWWFPLPELANLRVPLNGLIWIISTNCGKSKEMKIIQIYLLFKNKPLQLRRNPLGWDWCRDGYERITMVCLLWVVVV